MKDINGAQVSERSALQPRAILCFLVASLTSALLWDHLPTLPIRDVANCLSLRSNPRASTNREPKFAIYGKSPTEEHLIHVLNVLRRFGYRRTNIDEDWDLLWAHDYPFLNMPKRMKNLLPHQMVNHFPGCGFITNKVDLSTTQLPFLPKAFRLPSEKDEFLLYVNKHPSSLFVVKHNEHRHITIQQPHEIDLNSNDTFVQEFVQNPFLVDGYKFDIGVYVLLTSINPLRAYIYTGDVLFRYCPVKYNPFNESNVDKYVVGDDYLPTWQVPALKRYYESFSGSMRGAFDAYVRDQGSDPTIIWTQVEDIIRQTILSKEDDIARIMNSYKSGKFFDLLRFDLIIDSNLKVILMEANMSPNLSSAHFKPNSLLYEQILYSALNLVGIGTPIKRTDVIESANEINEMITAEKNIATDLNSCAKFNCDIACNLSECKLCLPCITGNELKTLEGAHYEHLHRIDMKRIFPKPIINLDDFNIEQEVQNLTERNAWLSRWLYAKCKYDRSWCS